MRREHRHVVPVPAKGEPENRDAGKVYLITEMPAEQGEEWAYRALCALARAGAQMPPGMIGTDERGNPVITASMQVLASFFFEALAGIPWEQAKPLLDEMMGCVQYLPDPGKPQVVRPLIRDDTEEISTRMILRKEVFKLHTDFFMSAVRSGSRNGTSQTTTDGSSSTSTSAP